MEQQKYSGIEWVGMIPQRWKVAPIGAYFYEVLNKNYDGAVKKALKFTYGNIVEKNNFDADSDEYVSSTIRKYTVVEPGTIMLNGLNLNFDFVTQRIGLVNTKGVITSSYVAFKSINEEYYNSKYANYLFKSYDFCKAFHNMGGGVRKILNFGELRKQYCVIPPINEQKAIVDFLDNKCSEIDSLVADIKKEISILEDYKKAVIDEAVTKGIVPKVKMKKSGILWNEFYPSNWSIKKLKYITINSRKGKGITKEQVVNDGELPCVRYGEIYSKYDSVITKCLSNTKKSFLSSIQYAKKGDILFAATGELIEEIGKNVLFDVEQECAIGGDIIIVTQNQNPSFINYALNSSYCQGQKSIGKAKLKVVHISASDILNIVLFLPPISEQNRIVSYLDDRCLQIKKVMTEKQSQLELLAEYKKSLIYEYVTGKKEVI